MSWSRTLKIRQVLRAQLEAGETIALLFSDLRGFSAYTASWGDEAAFRLSRLHEEILRAKIDEFGIVVKSFGDGVMAAFAEPIDAVRAAVAIQHAVRERNQGVEGEAVAVGIGISSGTPVMTDVDFIGHSVNLAQRLSGLAKGGQILVSEAISQGVVLPTGLGFLPLGERTLKGVGGERVAEVTWMREMARISDARDRVTLILTEGSAVVVELARDPKQPLRAAVSELRQARGGEDGIVSTWLQRVGGRIASLGLPESPLTREAGREMPLDRASLSFAHGTLRLETEEDEIVLRGVERQAAERFLREAERLRSGEEG